MRARAPKSNNRNKWASKGLDSQDGIQAVLLRVLGFNPGSLLAASPGRLGSGP